MIQGSFDTPEKLRAHCIAADKNMRAAMARYFDARQPPKPKPKPVRQRQTPQTSNLVIATAADMVGVSVAELLGARRYREIAEARFAIMAVYSAAGWSLPRIGRMLGDRDHTTVLNGLRRAERLLASDPYFAAMVKNLTIVFEDRFQ
jgi:hypothetical protein